MKEGRKKAKEGKEERKRGDRETGTGQNKGQGRQKVHGGD